MAINWKVRVKNKMFWLALIPAILLVVQVIADEREVASYSTEYFFRPEEYAQRGYEHVFAVTVTFFADEIN